MEFTFSPMKYPTKTWLIAFAAFQIVTIACGSGGGGSEGTEPPPAAGSPPPGGGATSFMLSVSVQGEGTVSSSPNGIACGSDCSEPFSPDASITLSAAAGSGSQFTGWAGDCSGVGTSCTLSMAAAHSVTAQFQATTPPGAAPTLSAAEPAADATNVQVGAPVRATFSEALDCATVNTGSFKLAGVTGAVSCSGSTAVFTPAAALAFGTTYTATLETSIKDTAGDALAGTRSWSFTTAAAPPPAGSNTRFSFLAYGDSRSGNGCDGNKVHISLVKRMAAEPDAPFVFNLGDMTTGYDSSTNWVQKGACTGTDNHGSFKDIVAPLMNKPAPAGLPTAYFPVVGNHDDNWNDGWYPDPFGNGFCDVFNPQAFVPNHTQQPYFAGTAAMKHTDAQFYALACSKTQRDVYPNYLYYSFDYGNSHFTVLRVNSDYDDLEECNNKSGAKNYDNCFRLHQLDWLRADLAAASARPGIQNIFVFLHAPLFTTSYGHAAQVSWPTLSKEFSKYNVKVAFSGHNHVYERSVPIFASATSPNGVRDDLKGTVYTVTGGGGSALHGFNSDNALIAKKSAAFHYLRVDVDGAKVSVKAVLLDGTVLDTYTR
jgi:hypothetical protein